MNKRGSVANRIAFFSQTLEVERKAAAKSPLLIPNPKNPSRWINSDWTSMKNPTNQDDGKPIDSKVCTVEKVPSQTRKAPRVLKKKPELKRQMSVSSLVLKWCQDVTKGYKGVDIKNFSSSFANGLAFCALIHKFHPDKIDFDSLDADNREHNVRLAIEVGTQVGIPAILEPSEFLCMTRPEPRSVQCYVQMIFSKYKPKDLDMSNLKLA